MSHAEPGYTPTIPTHVRAVVYVVGIAAGFLSMLAIGLAPALWPDQDVTITTCAGAIGTAVGWLSSTLGVAYRSPDLVAIAPSSVGD